MKLQDLIDRTGAALGVVADHFADMGPADVGISLALSVAVVGVVLAIQTGFARLLRRLADPDTAPGAVNTGINADRVIRLSIFLLRVLVWLAMVIGVLMVWGVDLVAFLSRGIGEKLLGISGRVTLLVVVGFLAYEIAGLAIARAFERLGKRSLNARRIAQLRTVRPIIIGIVQTAIVVMATMLTLSELGIQVGPLIAGAGIVGIAVGFGAQTLVKDFITGVFLIMEDILSVGDVVEIGGFGGTVEAMTFRTVRLRDLSGTLHIFPYSEAQIIHNRTNLFSFAVFDVQIGYSSSMDGAIAAMRQVGAAMRADPAFAAAITADIEVLGLDRMADSGVFLKARMKTQPGQQWRVGREFNRRIKEAFDAQGIEIPFPQMQLVMPGAAGALTSQMPSSAVPDTGGDPDGPDNSA